MLCSINAHYLCVPSVPLGYFYLQSYCQPGVGGGGGWGGGGVAGWLGHLEHRRHDDVLLRQVDVRPLPPPLRDQGQGAHRRHRAADEGGALIVGHHLLRVGVRLSG